MNLIPDIGNDELAPNPNIAGLCADICREIAELKTDMLRTMKTWLVISQAGTVAAIALVIALMDR